MKRVYTAWAKAGESAPSCLGLGEEPPQLANGEPMWDCDVVLFRVEADSHEEAMALYHLRCGFEPYKPVGAASPCPDCGALHYAQGSGQCWNCGHGVINAG